MSTASKRVTHHHAHPRLPEKKNLQHASIPPKALRGDIQAATNRAAFIVRSSHVDDQHRSDFHRQDHLCALLGHDSSFQARGWEGCVPWLLVLGLLRGVLLGGHCVLAFEGFGFGMLLGC